METLNTVRYCLSAEFETKHGIKTSDKLSDHYVNRIIAAHEREQWRPVSEPPAKTEQYCTDLGVAAYSVLANEWFIGNSQVFPRFWREIPQLPKELQNAK